MQKSEWSRGGKLQAAVLVSSCRAPWALCMARMGPHLLPGGHTGQLLAAAEQWRLEAGGPRRPLGGDEKTMDNRRPVSRASEWRWLSCGAPKAPFVAQRRQ